MSDLQLFVRPSHRLRAIMIVAVWLLPVAVYLATGEAGRSLLVFAIFALVTLLEWRQGQRAAELRWCEGEDWSVRFGEGQAEQGAQLISGSRLFTRFAWLRFRLPSGGTAGFLLLPDALSADEWRRLRVWAREQGTGEQPVDGAPGSQLPRGR